MGTWLAVAVVCHAACALALAQQQEPMRLLADSGIRGGLVVHIGASDGRLEAELARNGAFLVHGLALSDQAAQTARAAIRQRGVQGLASISGWRDRRRLPYASNLATVVIADLTALGDSAPSRAQIDRIVSPGGVIILNADGRWRLQRKPRPDRIDHWMHFDHGADGNPVSTDTIVGPIRQQQWLTGIQPNPFEGNPAGYAPGAGIRLWGRFAVIDANDVHQKPADQPTRLRDRWVLQSRDAFNGVPLWSIPRDRAVAQRRWSLVAGYGEVYAWLDPVGPLTALDIASGKVLRTYPGTDLNRDRLGDETVCIRATSDALVVGLRDRIICFDRTSARQRWQVSRDGRLLLGPVVDEPGERVYCLVARPGDRREFAGRWPTSAQTEALLAVNLKDGRTRWQCDDIASRDVQRKDKNRLVTYRRAPGQILPAGDRVVVFGSAAISGGEGPYIAAVDARTGRMLHQSDEPFQRSYNVAAYNVLWRDGAAWFAGAFTNIWRFDPASGQVQRVLTNSWNQRCTRFTATSRYFIFGQTAYYDSDLAGQQVCVARSGCAIGSIPANGLTYFTPTACGCITQVRGFQAMTAEPAPSPLPDEQRLQSGDGRPAAAPSDLPTRLPPGLLADEWPKQWRAGRLETDAITVGDVQLVAVVHQHRLEARRDGKVLWTFVADGRISSPPVVHDGVAVFGSHDGYVYALRVDIGALRWKYLLAPAERLICVNGQLESSWPVYGVCLDDSQPRRVIASAGTHVELDGGVTVAAFDPATGRPAWTRHLRKLPSVVPAGGKAATIVGYSFINSVPRLQDHQITLGDGGRKGGTFTFSPDDSEASLNERLAAPPKK